MAHAAETGTFRGNWIRFIYRTARITDSTRVLMLALSEAMDESGRVEATRDDVANLLDRSPRRMSARYTDAIDAGVLEQIQRGNRKTGSVFQALIPNGEHMTHGEHMFPRKHVTESRPLSRETCDGRGSHVSEETSDARGSRVGPNTCPPGVTSSEPPIRESSPATPELALFEVSEAPAPDATPKANTRSENQRINRFADLYYNAVGGMADYKKIRSVVKAAIARGRTDEELERGLTHHAADGRFTLTLEGLGVAINRSAPTQNGERHLKAVPGGHTPYKNPTNHDVYDEGLL